MDKRLLLFLGCIILSWNVGFSQANRSINGSLNNRQNVGWGSINQPLPRMVSVNYADDISTPNGANRPNPRVISNEIFAQDGLLNNPGKLSDYIWVFGQFIDHDVILVTNNATEPTMIPVNFIDPIFNPTGGLQVMIPMMRSKTFPGSGTSPSNPRQHFNEITAWLDASSVYGSDLRTANWLRSFEDGKLKVSSGNLLPFNTVDYEFTSDLDPDAPHMDNENPFNDRLFIAGDPRANENPLLAAFHTLFVREHNRLCDELKTEHPDWNDEELYQTARRWNIAYFQNIVFDEWLPAMGVNLPSYPGYDETVNPNISNIFSAAAFRLGHTLLNANIMRLDEQGLVIPEGNLTLRQAFFNPLTVLDTGLDPLFKGMAVQVMQDMDSKVVDDVRNFLFGAPGSGLGGLDLAAININRGRERGLPDFNTIRSDLGLTPYTSFIELTDNAELAQKLESLYGDINDIDAWVGMLSEKHMPDVLFGEVVLEIMMRQFQALRDGDRFFFENDPAFSPDDIAEIKSTTMHDIIMRNTNVNVMQDSVFIAQPHPLACAATAPYLSVNGQVLTEDGQGIGGVAMGVAGFSDPLNGTETESDGLFSVTEVPACYEYTVTAEKTGAARNGLSTFDLIILSKHITSQDTLDSPYKMIAADINNSKSITTFDVIELRKMILFINTNFPDNDSWKFIPTDYQFNDPQNPLAEDYPTIVELEELTDVANVNFVGVKIGDLNGSADLSGLQENERGQTRSYTDVFTLHTKDKLLEAKEEYLIPFYASEKAVIGMQFGLKYTSTFIDQLEVVPNKELGINENNFAILSEKDLLTASWHGDMISTKMPLFYLRVRTTESLLLSQLFALTHSQEFISEAYEQNLEHMALQLNFDDEVATYTLGDINLYQNQPNPFVQFTTFGFALPKAMPATIRITDVSGKVVYEQSGEYAKGYHQHEVSRGDFPTNGVYFYQLRTEEKVLTKKMIINGKEF